MYFPKRDESSFSLQMATKQCEIFMMTYCLSCYILEGLFIAISIGVALGVILGIGMLTFVYSCYTR